MEKKKILLVAVSVGVFLVIVLGAAILVFSPHNAVPAASTAAAPIPAGASAVGAGTVPAEALPLLPSQPASVDPADMVRNSDGIRSLQTPPGISTEPREDNFFVNGENERQSITITAPALTESGNTGANTVISVPRPTTAAVPDTPPASRAVARAAPPPQAAPAARTSSPARSTTTAAPPPAKAAAAPSAAVNRNDFWVQTGSFSTKNRAEGAKDMLIAKGITPIIENRDVDGKTFFRVRVGPYTSRNEADYWLSLIKSINGFEDSQIWISQSRP
jgi:DedD protein